MTEMQEGAPRGALLRSSLMYLYSGAPMHLCSGVDSYHAALRIQAFEGVAARPEADSPAPQAVTVWEGVLGFAVRAREEPGSAPADIRLRFDLRRTGAHTFFALAEYGTMVVLACRALAIGLMVF